VRIDSMNPKTPTSGPIAIARAFVAVIRAEGAAP
jgi:hypothetical protein